MLVLLTTNCYFLARIMLPFVVGWSAGVTIGLSRLSAVDGDYTHDRFVHWDFSQGRINDDVRENVGKHLAQVRLSTAAGALRSVMQLRQETLCRRWLMDCFGRKISGYIMYRRPMRKSIKKLSRVGKYDNQCVVVEVSAINFLFV